jgi:hypothetical protein
MPERNPPPAHPEIRYEKSDARIGWVVAFGIMLAVMVLIVHVSAVWLFDGLKVGEDRRYQPLPSLAAKERMRLPHDLEKIPPPRLQKSELMDMAKLRQAEESLLNSYGWVDRNKGFVRIPIDEAMRLLANTKTAEANGIRVRSLKERKK